MTRDGVFVAADPLERQDAFGVRTEVFVEEQGVPRDLELDEHDADAVHFVAYEEGRAVGAARLRSTDGGEAGKVERVAVLSDRRGDGWGRRLMETAEETAAERGMDRLTLHSQTHAAGFYRDLDYATVGDVFEEAGIPHVEMEKALRPLVRE